MAAMLDGKFMASYEVLTFDCYGTLIDWERGMQDALAGVIEKRGLAISAEEVHGRYARLEPRIQDGSNLKYREVMRIGVKEAFREFGVSVTSDQADAFGETLASWPKFSDTTEVLTKLKAQGYKLVILSNTDEDFILESLKMIDVEFDAIITAERVGSYKPARGHWDFMLEKMRVPKEKVLHVAQSHFHDVVPAKNLGFTIAWINRKDESPNVDTRPDYEFPNLRGLLMIP